MHWANNFLNAAIQRPPFTDLMTGAIWRVGIESYMTDKDSVRHENKCGQTMSPCVILSLRHNTIMAVLCTHYAHLCNHFFCGPAFNFDVNVCDLGGRVLLALSK